MRRDSKKSKVVLEQKVLMEHDENGSDHASEQSEMRDLVYKHILNQQAEGKDKVDHIEREDAVIEARNSLK